MTEATTPERVTGVQTHTRPATIWRAKATLAQITPYRIWIRQGRRRDARTLADARALYLDVVRELGATIAGHRPDEIAVIVKKEAGPDAA
jgi:hypothetical protein